MNKKLQFISLDKIGMCASAVCAVHCLLIPFFLIFGLEGMLWWIDNEWVELLIISITVSVGSVSFILGYRKHRQHFVPVLFVAGLLLIVNGEAVSQEWLGATLSILGAVILIYAHFNNLQLRQHARS